MFNLLLTINWYDKLVASLPNGKLFSWRAVFDAIPSILEKLPTTLILTLGGSIFGLVLALLFAIVKLNRVKILYPIQAFFVSFLRGTPILVQLMLTYYGIPLLLKALNQKMGTDFNINAIPASVFAITAFAFNEAAYTSETIRAAIQSVNSGEIEAALGGSAYRYFERFLSVAIIYWGVSIIIEQVGRLIEKKMEIASPDHIVKDQAVEGGVR